MKLFLHWLRWDLRRFRVPLLIWVGSVALFTGWLIWLHLNQLTLSMNLPEANEPIGAALGILEFFLVLYILTTDPAEGTRPFWKTRPPSGFMLAGVKITLMLVFFVLLPLAGHRLMRLVCGFSEPRAGWSGHTWQWMLWWTQCLALSVMTLVTAGAKNAGHALLRLGAGALVLLVPVVIWMPMWESDSAAERWMMDVFRPIHEGIFSLRPVTLWLCAGVAVFVTARRTRMPSRMSRWAPLVLPPVALLTGGRLAEKEERRERVDGGMPTLPAEMVSGLKIGEPLLRGGTLPSSHVINSYAGPFAKGATSGLYFYLHMTGLPADCKGNGQWMNLRITAPDGRTVEAEENRGPLNFLSALDPGQGILSVGSVQFPADKLAPFSRTACRLEGVLRVWVLRRHVKKLPVEAGQRAQLGNTSLMLREILAHQKFQPQEWFVMSVVGRGPYAISGYWLQHVSETEKRVPFGVEGGSSTAGYFMEQRRDDQRLFPARGSYPVATASAGRALENGNLTDWRLHIEWNEAVGTADIPVTVENVFIPRQMGDMRAAADVLKGMAVTPQMSAAEVRRMVRFTLSMGDLGRDLERDTDDEPLLRTMSRVLETVPREHLPMLLGLSKEEMWPVMAPNSFDKPLRKRIAAVMEPADVVTLREKEPEVFQYLRADLAERKLISASEGQDPPWKEQSDEQLLKAWRRCKFAADSVVNTLPLQAALVRGLPWSVTELADIVGLIPDRDADSLKVLMKISDCPRHPWEAVRWVRENASRLAWDAAAKRWVLPKP